MTRRHECTGCDHVTDTVRAAEAHYLDCRSAYITTSRPRPDEGETAGQLDLLAVADEDGAA